MRRIICKRKRRALPVKINNCDVLTEYDRKVLDATSAYYRIIMLRRLILAVQQGTRYDETLLPEEEAEQALENMKSEG